MRRASEQRADRGLALGNCRPFVERQKVVKWPESGVEGSGHKRAAGNRGFWRPSNGPELN